MQPTPAISRFRFAAAAAAPVFAAAAPGGAAAQEALSSPCGNPFVNHFGPFDYRKAPAHEKQLVESAHFTIGVQTLTKPSTTTWGTMAQDVGYTLHVFPNHHRALMTMVRLGERHKAAQPPGAKYTIDCYFDRATRYAPDDTVVRGLYAQYLAKNGQRERALQQLAVGVEYAKDNPFSHFSLGLLYFDLGDHEHALQQAQQAQVLGLPRTELIDRLKSVGKWVEPGG